MFRFVMLSLLLCTQILASSPQEDVYATIQKSADSGDAKAQCVVGDMYLVREEYAEALKWFKKAADQKMSLACVYLHAIYSDGLGVVADQKEAAKWENRMSTTDADWRAMEEVKQLISKLSLPVLERIRKRADEGHAYSQFELGVIYQRGKVIPKDDSEAIKWLTKAADAGLITAQRYLGGCYVVGQLVPQDNALAASWLRKAAEKGDADAAMSYAQCCEEGLGVPKNLTEAVRWYKLAAETGSALSQVKLGSCYTYGEGVEKNDVEAVK